MGSHGWGPLLCGDYAGTMNSEVATFCAQAPALFFSIMRGAGETAPLTPPAHDNGVNHKRVLLHARTPMHTHTRTLLQHTSWRQTWHPRHATLRTSRHHDIGELYAYSFVAEQKCGRDPAFGAWLATEPTVIFWMEYSSG